MVSFIGRSGHHSLFAEEDHGVIVDSRCGVVVASGVRDTLLESRTWEDGEFSLTDEEAAIRALDSLAAPLPEPTGRLYTIPRGVQNAAKRGLEAHQTLARGGTQAGVLTASLLASGGQISFERLAAITQFFERHADDEFSDRRDPMEDGTPSSTDITWRMWGGDSAKKWATNIVGREAVTAGGSDFAMSDLDDLLEREPEASPEFIARVRMDGTGIDRLYRIDLDNRSYVWDDSTWTDLGFENGDIWIYDRELDGYSGVEPVESVHTIIDPESAIAIAAMLRDHPFEPVFVEDLDPQEARLVEDAIPDIDWEVLDQTITAAGAVGDGIYTPEERSENATAQVRDATGRFAKTGVHVVSDSDPSISGKIVKIDGATKMATIQQDDGTTKMAPVNVTKPGVRLAGSPVPGRPVETPRVDFSGILGEPRTPINRNIAQIPGTLPQMTSADLRSIINKFPAWVKAQRDSFSPLTKSPRNVNVQAKGSLDVGKAGRELMKETGTSLTVDAYDHPLLTSWLKQKSRSGAYQNSLWYRPITAALGEPVKGEVTPENSDVQPIYLAVVSPDDPRAVFKLISLVPASGTSNAPAAYSREEGEWNRDEQALNDLNSATPPPVVPLDKDTLNEVLVQVDESQGVEDKTEETPSADEPIENTAPPIEEPDPVPTPADAPAPVAASAFDLSVLWGPRQDFMDAAITAAGGADRNRGGAEKLRRYWTEGAGGAKIKWGTAGDWTRCVRYLGKHLGPRAKGYCALRHKEMTGLWTGDQKHRQMFSINTGGTVYSDAMIASTEDIELTSQLRARAEVNKLRMLGLTASADPRYRMYEDAEQALTAGAVSFVQAEGAKFLIPLALPEGVESGDGRTVDPGAATWRDLPFALMWQVQTGDGHSGSYVVGRIDSIERVEGGIGNARGVFDTGVWGREAERMVRAGMLRGVSADMDKFEAQQGVSPEAAEDEKGGKSIGKDKLAINSTRIMGITIVAKPAFQECAIQIEEDFVIPEDDLIPDGIYVDEVDPIDAAALVAAGYVASHIPLAPPKAWFDNPRLDGPTPLTVTDEGKVFGHVAAWEMDHIGLAYGTKPPRSRSGYAYFHSGVVRTEEGDDVQVGQLTLAGGHAGLEASAREAVKHYDDTGSAFADVHAGEDAYGIWVSGALRPGTQPEQVRAIRASAPSGDWRPIRGQLEMVAVCQVNVPGFPIARARVASGHVMALTAAGAMTLAKMKTDPISELAARLERLEQFSDTDLAARVASVRQRFAPALEARDAELASRAEAVLARAKEFGYVSKDERAEIAKRIPKSEAVTASVASMRDRIAQRQTEFAATRLEEKRIREALDESGKGVGDGGSPKAPSAEDNRAKYTPDTQPRDWNGQFRDVLARLKDNLGVNGNQAVLEKLQAAEKYGKGGDYAGAAQAAADLKNSIDRMDTGALSSDSLTNIRAATTDLANVIAKLPLPFDNQAEKVRFSDLPPALRDLIDDFVTRVENKIGGDDAKEATAPLKAFMSGGDVFAQGEINQQLNILLRLLT